MLRISKKADYAVFLLGAIARQGAFPGGSAADSVVSAHEIARQAGLNKSVVANLLKEFARHGLLDSVRGLRGGYRLARPPHDISLGQILEVVEGKFVLVDCVSPEFSAEQQAQADLRAQAPSKGAPGIGASSRKPGMTAADRDGKPALLEPPDHHDCSLISFCPSKQPMRVVHERISKLFADIHLDELCALKPAPTSSTCAPTDATTGDATTGASTT